MIERPTLASDENDFVRFVHQWIQLCATGKISEAFALLDTPADPTHDYWTAEDLHEITFDHFDDGKQPNITDPDHAKGVIRKDVFQYSDGSGWGVAYDLPMNGVVSDFTVLFDFIKSEDELQIILKDCHVM